MGDHEKSETPTAGRTQDSPAKRFYDTSGTGSPDQADRIHRDEPCGVHGEPSPWGNSISGAVLGKLIDQLISAEIDQLEESRQCLAWYEEHIAKAEQRLSQLRDLASLRLEQDQEN